MNLKLKLIGFFLGILYALPTIADRSLPSNILIAYSPNVNKWEQSALSLFCTTELKYILDTYTITDFKKNLSTSKSSVLKTLDDHFTFLATLFTKNSSLIQRIQNLLNDLNPEEQEALKKLYNALAQTYKPTGNSKRLNSLHDWIKNQLTQYLTPDNQRLYQVSALFFSLWSNNATTSIDRIGPRIYFLLGYNANKEADYEKALETYKNAGGNQGFQKNYEESFKAVVRKSQSAWEDSTPEVQKTFTDSKDTFAKAKITLLGQTTIDSEILKAYAQAAEDHLSTILSDKKFSEKETVKEIKKNEISEELSLIIRTLVESAWKDEIGAYQDLLIWSFFALTINQLEQKDLSPLCAFFTENPSPDYAQAAQVLENASKEAYYSAKNIAPINIIYPTFHPLFKALCPSAGKTASLEQNAQPLLIALGLDHASSLNELENVIKLKKKNLNQLLKKITDSDASLKSSILMKHWEELVTDLLKSLDDGSGKLNVKLTEKSKQLQEKFKIFEDNPTKKAFLKELLADKETTPPLATYAILYAAINRCDPSNPKNIDLEFYPRIISEYQGTKNDLYSLLKRPFSAIFVSALKDNQNSINNTPISVLAENTITTTPEAFNFNDKKLKLGKIILSKPMDSAIILGDTETKEASAAKKALDQVIASDKLSQLLKLPPFSTVIVSNANAMAYDIVNKITPEDCFTIDSTKPKIETLPAKKLRDKLINTLKNNDFQTNHTIPLKTLKELESDWRDLINESRTTDSLKELPQTVSFIFYLIILAHLSQNQVPSSNFFTNDIQEILRPQIGVPATTALANFYKSELTSPLQLLLLSLGLNKVTTENELQTALKEKIATLFSLAKNNTSTFFASAIQKNLETMVKTIQGIEKFKLTDPYNIKSTLSTFEKKPTPSNLEALFSLLNKNDVKSGANTKSLNLFAANALLFEALNASNNNSPDNILQQHYLKLAPKYSSDSGFLNILKEPFSTIAAEFYSTLKKNSEQFNFALSLITQNNDLDQNAFTFYSQDNLADLAKKITQTTKDDEKKTQALFNKLAAGLRNIALS